MKSAINAFLSLKESLCTFTDTAADTLCIMTSMLAAVAMKSINPYE